MNKCLRLYTYFFLLCLISFRLSAQDTLNNITVNNGFILLNDIPALEGNPKAIWGNYFWEFGDGHYKMTEKSSVDYTYSESGIYNVRASLTPYYTVVSKPITYYQDNVAINGVPTNAPSYNMNDRYVNIVTNSRYEVVADHEIRVVLHYEMPPSAKSSDEGYLFLFYNKKGEIGDSPDKISYESFSYLDADTRTYAKANSSLMGVAFPALSSTAKSSIQQLQNEHVDVLVFKTSSLSRGQENRIFLSLKANPELADIADMKRELSFTAAWAPLSGTFDPEKHIHQYSMDLLEVHDPNKIEVFPKVAYYKKGRKQKLFYTIDFQNEAEGIVRDVIVRFPLAKNHDASTAKIDPNKNSTYAVDKDLVWNYHCSPVQKENNKCLSLGKNSAADSLLFTFHNIDLFGKDHQLIGPFNKKLTKGRLSFSILTDGTRANKNKSQVDIIFRGAEAMATNKAKVKWRQSAFYLKTGLNSAHDFGVYLADAQNFMERASVGLIYDNTPLGTGISWGIEGGLTSLTMRRSNSTAITNNLTPNGGLWVQNERISMRMLEAQARVGYQFGGFIKGFASAGLSVPAFADLSLESDVVHYTVDAQETVLADAIDTGFGIFNSSPDAELFNQTISTNNFMGFMTNVGLEAGLLNNLSVGIKGEMRFYPNFYYTTDKCFSVRNTEVFLRFRLFSL